MSDTASDAVVNVRSERGFAVLSLARPARGNALDVTLVEALLGELDALRTRDDVHTWVFRGEGPQFCTGFDLGDAARHSDGDLLLRFVRVESLLQAIAGAPVRTVAFAHGRAWGAGADLFAACDVRVAHMSSTFRFPGVRFGLALGTRRLVQRVGESNAHAILTEGRTLNADQALACGLATARVDGNFDDWFAAQPLPVVEHASLPIVLQRLRTQDADADLAALVRSASRPGLADRIAAYRKSPS